MNFKIIYKTLQDETRFYKTLQDVFTRRNYLQEFYHFIFFSYSSLQFSLSILRTLFSTLYVEYNPTSWH